MIFSRACCTEEWSRAPGRKRLKYTSPSREGGIRGNTAKLFFSFTLCDAYSPCSLWLKYTSPSREGCIRGNTAKLFFSFCSVRCLLSLFSVVKIHLAQPRRRYKRKYSQALFLFYSVRCSLLLCLNTLRPEKKEA
jgi:hypothetical protein